MSGKRQATTNLNHDNWDQEEEPEERGTFKTAPPEELKARVIKKATRRKAEAGGSDADETGATPSNSVFSGFSGFGKPASTPIGSSGTVSPFAFLSSLKSADAAASAPAAAAPKPTMSFLASSDKTDSKLTTPAKMFSFEAKKPMLESTSTVNKSPITSIFGMPSAAAAASASAAEKPMFKSSVAVDKPTANSSPTTSSSASSDYCNSVAELNWAVMKFLKEHMDKNPYCILTPVFSSYDRFLKGLKPKDDAKCHTEYKLTHVPSATTAATGTTTTSAALTASASMNFSFGKPNTAIGSGSSSTSTALGKKPQANCTVTSGGSTIVATPPKFSFGTSSSAAITSPSSSAKTEEAKPMAPFSFGLKPPSDAPPKMSFFSFANKESTSKDAAAPTATAATPPKTNGFSFGLKSDDKPSTSGFTGFGKPASEATAATNPTNPSGFSFATPPAAFAFGNLKPPTAAAIEAAAAEAAEDEDDTPPKAEFNKVVEDDAIFSKRCKVFVKKDKDFTDRGVGTLYLKPVKDSEKTQMLVRADTNLGNILINLILSKGLPCQRMGKNNVMMVCIPTPEEAKAMSILLRVKSGEEADELLEQIKTHSV